MLDFQKIGVLFDVVEFILPDTFSINTDFADLLMILYFLKFTFPKRYITFL